MTILKQLPEAYHIKLYRELNSAARYQYDKQLKLYQQAGLIEHLPYLRETLSDVPNKDGSRASYAKRLVPWQQVLLNITTEITIDAKTNKVKLSKDGKLVNEGAVISWAYQNPNNGFKFETVTRLLKENYRKLVLDAKGKIIPANKTDNDTAINDGRRIVHCFKDEQQQPLAFVKVYPELPGRQLAVDSLTHRITGSSVQATLASLTPIVKGRQQQKARISLMLSKPAGITVQDWCRKQPKQPIAVDNKGQG